MTKVGKDTVAQLAVARKAMDQYQTSLAALAGSPPDPSSPAGEAFARQMQIARERMKKYQPVYRSLAK